MKILKKLDQFGVPFTPFVKDTQIKYKSAFGGTVSILLYSTLLAFFIYLMILWRNGQILPTISNQTVLATESTTQSFQYSPISIDLMSLSYENASYRGKKIFEVKFGKYKGQKVEEMLDLSEEIICNNEENPVIVQSTCIRFDKSKSITQDQVNGDENIAMYLYKCDPLEQENCVTEEELKEISKNSDSWFRIQLWNEQYDYKTGQTKLVSQILYQVFDLDLFYLTQVQMIQGQYNIDSGYFLSNANKKQLAIDNLIAIQSQSIEKSPTATFEKKLAYMTMTFGISRKMQIIDIQYAKFGELIAQVGAYYQIFMGLAFFVNVFNELKLHSSILSKTQKKKSLSKNKIFRLLLVSQFPIQQKDDSIKCKRFRNALNINNILNILSKVEELKNINKLEMKDEIKNEISFEEDQESLKVQQDFQENNQRDSKVVPINDEKSNQKARKKS